MTDSRRFSRRTAPIGFVVAFLATLLTELVILHESLGLFVFIEALTQGAVLGIVFHFVLPENSPEK
mgnify:FL=1